MHLCVREYRKGPGGVDDGAGGVPALLSSPPPPPPGLLGSWLNTQGHYNLKPAAVRIRGV